MIEAFGGRLRFAVEARGPLCVGIDPHAALLDAWGLPQSASGLERFALTVVDALADRVAVVKPQSAFFERFGSAGIAVLERTIAAARAAGALVILDAKRGDIGSTAAAYAQAYLEPDSPLFADALTVHPYLGFGSLDPLLETAFAHGTGLFVVALTSNPEGGQVQTAVDGTGRTVAQAVVDSAASRNTGAVPLGSIGVVIGATTAGSDAIPDLRNLNGPILAPGLGAQGAVAADLAVFGDARSALVPSYSREILRAGPSVDALRIAVERLRTDLAAVLGK